MTRLNVQCLLGGEDGQVLSARLPEAGPGTWRGPFQAGLLVSLQAMTRSAGDAASSVIPALASAITSPATVRVQPPWHAVSGLDPAAKLDPS